MVRMLGILTSLILFYDSFYLGNFMSFDDGWHQGRAIRAFPLVGMAVSCLGMGHFIMNPEMFPHAERSFLRWYARCMVVAAIMLSLLLNMAEGILNCRVLIRILWAVMAFITLCLLCLAALLLVYAAVN